MRTIYREGHVVRLIDQTRLPADLHVLDCATCEALCDAVRRMQIRGAPALGVAAAYAMALAGQEAPFGWATFVAHMDRAADLVKGTRPTAVNLSWGVQLALDVVARASAKDVATLRADLWQLADDLAEADVATNQLLGDTGSRLLADGSRILTHCNTGSLATVDWGTALGVVRSAHRAGKALHVYVDETRPFLQGSRLTAWELEQEGIPYTIITDSMAGYLMAQEEVDLCIVGADRIAACGDVANKIGTYSLAVLAHAHGVPFYVAAPTSTIDLNTPNGAAIPIEERDPSEVLGFGGLRVAPLGAHARHPAFDVTPSRYVTAIITEAGILHPPYLQSLADALKTKSDAAGRPAIAGGRPLEDA